MTVMEPETVQTLITVLTLVTDRPTSGRLREHDRRVPESLQRAGMEVAIDRWNRFARVGPLEVPSGMRSSLGTAPRGSLEVRSECR